MTLAINPPDATVFAPTLPRGYDTRRPAWDGPAPLTVSLLLHAPYYLDVTSGHQVRPRAMLGGVGGSAPDAGSSPLHGQVARVSQYEFGLTNGLFRLMRRADALGLEYAVALDDHGCRRVPGLARSVAARAGEVVVRGEAATSIISTEMTHDQERDYIERCRDAVAAATGRDVTGWFGPERGLTDRTTGLLRDAGFRWFGDWTVDEVPVALDGRARGLTALPFSLDTEDSFQLYGRGMRFDDYEELVIDAIDRLVADADVVGPRFLGLSWAGWVLGQACYAGVAERVMTRIAQDPSIRVVLPSAAIATPAHASA